MARIFELDNGTGIIQLEDGLSTSTEQQAGALIKTPGVKTIILDFCGLTSFDCQLPSMLVRLYNSCSQTRRRLLATGLSENTRHIFKISGLNGSIPSFDSVEAAVASTGYTGSLDTEIRGKKPDTAARPPAVDNAWAGTVNRLAVRGMPAAAINLNVEGRRPAGPMQGFGQLWQKTYRAEIRDAVIRPVELIKILKDNFPEFQPASNRFYASPAGIKPGEVIIINADTPGGLVVTGVMVLHASDTCFTFITPEGHPEAGWVTFRAYEEEGKVVMQIQGLARASDPVYEIAFRLAGSKLQQQIWSHVLESLLRHIGSNAPVEVTPVCLDTRLKWTKIFNVFANAQIWSMIYLPVILMRKLTGTRVKQQLG